MARLKGEAPQPPRTPLTWAQRMFGRIPPKPAVRRPQISTPSVKPAPPATPSPTVRPVPAPPPPIIPIQGAAPVPAPATMPGVPSTDTLPAVGYARIPVTSSPTPIALATTSQAKVTNRGPFPVTLVNASGGKFGQGVRVLVGETTTEPGPLWALTELAGTSTVVDVASL